MNITNVVNNINVYDKLKKTIDDLGNSKIYECKKEKLIFHNNSTTNSLFKKKFIVYLFNEKFEMHPEEIQILGAGGSKTALKISNGHALLVPNMRGYPSELVQSNWEPMARKEVTMSEKLRYLGLLSPESKLVGLSFSPTGETGYIPAYEGFSFEYLAENGCFIIDTKNSNSSTWKMGENYIFPSDLDRFDEVKWDKVVNPLLTDIAKILIYDIPLTGDSLNMAIVKSKLSNDYNARYFGFDYSFKNDHLVEDRSYSHWTPTQLNVEFSKPKPTFTLEDRDDKWLQRDLIGKINRCLPEFIDILICYEFYLRYGLGVQDQEDSRKIESLKQNLIKKYSLEILKRLLDSENYNF